jgi:hypothetical protein
MHKSILDHKKVLAVDDERDILSVLEEEIKSSCPDCAVDRSIMISLFLTSWVFEVLIFWKLP